VHCRKLSFILPSVILLSVVQLNVAAPQPHSDFSRQTHANTHTHTHTPSPTSKRPSPLSSAATATAAAVAAAAGATPFQCSIQFTLFSLKKLRNDFVVRPTSAAKHIPRFQLS